VGKKVLIKPVINVTPAMQPGIPVIRRYDGRDRDVAQSDTVRRDPRAALTLDGETVRIEATQSTPRTAGTLPASWSAAPADDGAAVGEADADGEAAATGVEAGAAATGVETAVAATGVETGVAATGARADIVGRAESPAGRVVLGWLGRGRGRLARALALGVAARVAVADRFRLPASNDPAPQPGRMLGVCAWATALGFVGVGVALRALVALLAGRTPAWFEPTITTVGMVGIALTTAAFASVHRNRLPWALLGASTVTLGVALAANVVAL
jgi:hypothetical protein